MRKSGMNLSWLGGYDQNELNPQLPLRHAKQGASWERSPAMDEWDFPALCGQTATLQR